MTDPEDKPLLERSLLTAFLSLLFLIPNFAPGRRGLDGR
jgi:hypothetical protein